MKKILYLPILALILLMTILVRPSVTNRTIALKPDIQFDSGAVENIYQRPDGSLAFSIPSEPGGPEYLWFNFRVTGGVASGQVFALKNAVDAHQTGRRWNTTRPVFSADGINWVRATEVDYSREFSLRHWLGLQVFHFMSPITAETLHVAYCYPYTQRELDEFLAAFKERLYSEVFSIGKSEEGRDIHCFQIGPDKPLDPTSIPEIWIICREHPGETPASFVLEGMIQGLLNSSAGRHLADQFAIKIVPLLNVDGIAHGYYYHNANGVNLAEDWADKKSAEVRKLQGAMKPALEKKRVRLVVNLHSSNDTRLGHFFLEMPNSQLYPPDSDLQSSLFHATDGNYAQLQGKSTVRLRDDPGITGNALYHEFGVYCLYLESNYSLGADGSPVTQESLRETGKALVQGITEVLAGED